jgi:hypothetical protein
MKMRNIAILTSVLYLSGCATIGNVNGVDTTDVKTNKQLWTTVGTIVVVGALAGALGKENAKSKCANNRAGFWQDHSTGKIYTCP